MMNLTFKIRAKISTYWYKFFGTYLFKSFDSSATIICPLKIEGNKNITIQKQVQINYRTWLAALPLTGENTCDLIIGEGSIIGNFNHIYATKNITIGKNVLIADKVYISDNLHSYEDITLPISKQPIKQLKSVIIGDGTWIGENVCILGVSIGVNCVIGANSVVTKEIPDYCVAVGSPARVIKEFNRISKTWEKV